MGSKQTTTQRADPWGPSQPFIKEGLRDAAALYREGGFNIQPYGGDMVAGYDPMRAEADAGTRTAFGNAMDMAGQGWEAIKGAMDPNARQDYVVLDRMLTHEAVGLPLARGDDDFRLVVDSALSRLFASTGFKDVYSKWVGSYDESTRTFFQWVALPK